MGMQESIERLKNSKIVPDFTWWDGKVFLEIAEKVERAGPGAIVKMYQGLKETGLPEVWFTVGSRENVTAKGEGGGTNDSRPCPPLC